MKKTTDFQQVKKVVVSLLHLPIKPTPLSPAIVSHPIFQSGAYYANNGGSWELIPLLGSEDNLARARNEIESQINDCKTLDRLLALVLLPYQLTFLKYAKPFLSEEDFSRLVEQADELEVIAVCVPNQKGCGKEGSWQQYVCSVDYIEEITGYDFFELLPDDIEEEIESKVMSW